MSPVFLTHNRVRLALHHLRPQTRPDGGDLLVLHGLGEATPDVAPGWSADWPGNIWGLDFTGHGSSTLAPGGGYTAEILMADAALAIGHLDSPTVVGRGLGAYVALLAAGACASDLRGVVLADGPGLAGGGPAPGSPSVVTQAGWPTGPPDPFALMELSRDVRPADYAVSWVHMALDGSTLDEPITVAARVRPPWLAAVAETPGVREAGLAEALTLYATV